MNEDITRILQMLESGRISAEEAEKLIRALRESGERTAAPRDFWAPRPDPFRDVRELFTMFRQAARQCQRRKVRHFWRHYFRINRWYEEQRRSRERTMTTFERVRFVLLGALLDDSVTLQPETRLSDILKWDQVGWDNLIYGLEYEFRIGLTRSDVERLGTIQDLVNLVGARKSGGTTPEPTPESAPGPEPAPEPEPSAESAAATEASTQPTPEPEA